MDNGGPNSSWWWKHGRVSSEPLTSGYATGPGIRIAWHSMIDGFPFTAFQGPPRAHVESQHLAAATTAARRVFRDATLASDFGADVLTELVWYTSAAKFRQMLATLRHSSAAQ